ncbi:DUF956 family protein [Carnobacteriaceae bacterium zg-ZUI78]|uniref:DUF956 family protein n=1 Tax=Granulicatella sp. zg-84 TaxID=2678503 RepID=UPI0013BF655E|nr:DUF956 family protein [Granulicatella sp. zg-84]MBS4750206.1 DUF956 family protein [Carnobacteriaceae bacterium zg-ZUI78]NEW66939.1 DUF956 family protein [Granulicatella sp. zg-84]QMI85661.1 DUF956 family protein [Carnobacteriaceae bacterium zg-84]
MVVSQNTKVDFTTKANSFHSGITAKNGSILIGDKAIEFYYEKNPNDFVQIPWQEIDKVRAQLYFNNRYIRGFFVDTKKNGSFNFVVKDAGKALKIMREYLGNDKIVKNVPFLSLKSLFKRK